MITNEIETLLKKHPDIDFVDLSGDGKHYTLTIVSDVFVDLPKVKRQLWVYTLLNPYIVSGALHAIQMDAWTKAEWSKLSGHDDGNP